MRKTTTQLLWYLSVILTISLYTSSTLSAQVGINILQPDTSAILHLESTDRGFLPPRMTTQQRDNIVQPKPGLTVYNTTDSSMQYYNGGCWLYTWQRNCDDCAFDFQIQNTTGNIDRIFSNSDSTELYISQLVGSAQPIAVYIIPNLPQGITATLDQFTVNGSDTIMLTVNADIFAPPGNYPVIVQAVCGNSISNQVFVITVEPCIEVDINTPQTNYDLQAAAGLPSGTPICVVARVGPGVQMDNDTTAPVFTTGNLHPQSQVGILNEGDMLGRGGDGGAGTSLQGTNGTGFDGTDAIDLTVSTHIVNNGRIFAGGGGGGSVGFLVSIPLPGSSFDLGIGAGGGGGAQGGAGGNVSVSLPIYEPGQAATTGVFASAGAGGLLNAAISIPITVVTLTITPNANGGDGGEYGVPGTEGFLFVNVQVSVPIIGTIFNQDFPDPPVTDFPDGGAGGFAIRRNGNPVIGISDGIYQSSAIKGEVGN